MPAFRANPATGIPEPVTESTVPHIDPPGEPQQSERKPAGKQATGKRKPTGKQED